MSNNVPIAFDILLEEIENTIDELTHEGARAFESKDLASANQLAQKGEQIDKDSSKNNLDSFAMHTCVVESCSYTVAACDAVAG